MARNTRVEKDPPADSGRTAAAEGGSSSGAPLRRTAEPRDKTDFSDLKFVVSNRRSGLREPDALKRSREAFSHSFATMLSANVDVLHDLNPHDEEARRVIVVEGDPREIARKMADLHPDVLVELYQPRHLQRLEDPSILALNRLVGCTPLNPGEGAQITLHITAAGKPAAGARATIYLASTGGAGKPATQCVATADSSGTAVGTYDPHVWTPAVALIEPANGAWNVVARPVSDGQAIDLPPVTDSGPLGWWGLLTGATAYSEENGKGIKVGVADTGVGPHPYLNHVNRLGSFLNGQPTKGAKAATDCDRHGTHVSGIIAARPPSGPAFGGIAAGAELFMARVFPSGHSEAGQGDIALAIEALATESEVDLINLSLGGGPSMIEADAIQVAFEHGTLCLAAAGNGYGQPVLYPAALQNVVAISALGLAGRIPPGAMEACNAPSTPDKRTSTGMYVAVFSNYGPQIAAISPGDGIISTVPAGNGFAEPYVPMSGTSMACPVATAALATLLGKNDSYKKMPRNGERAAEARRIFQATLFNLGLNPQYQGGGLIRQR